MSLKGYQELKARGTEYGMPRDITPIAQSRARSGKSRDDGLRSDSMKIGGEARSAARHREGPGDSGIGGSAASKGRVQSSLVRNKDRNYPDLKGALTAIHPTDAGVKVN